MIMSDTITQRHGLYGQRGVWCIVKGKGDYRMRTKVHCMTGHRSELGAQDSWCGQSFIVITTVMDVLQAKFPEIYCRKCLKVIEKL